MTKNLVTVAMLAFAAAGAPSVAAAQSRDHNPTLDSVNQPVVQRTDFVIDLAAGGGGVADQEIGRLADWFDTLRLGYGDRVSVDTGSYDDPRARRDVAALAARYGLLLSHGYPMTAGTVQPGSVRVVVSRSVASVPGCPNWNEARELGNRMTSGSNYGCAMNSNLAAMIADPNDLVLGQAGAISGNGDTATKAIKVYRDTPPTGTKGLKDTVTRGGR